MFLVLMQIGKSNKGDYMSHGIQGKDKVLIEKDAGWHGLGISMEEITPKQVRTSFDWDYEKSPMFLANGTEVADHKAITSEGEAIGVVGDKYQIIGIEDMIQLAETIITQHGTGRIVSTGTLHGRQDFFMDLYLGQEFRNQNDVLKAYIGLTNNSIGSRKFCAGAHTNRIVCANTQRIALSEMSTERCLKVKHTISAFTRLSEAKRILGIACASFEKADTEMQAMVAKQLTDTEVYNFYSKIMPSEVLPSMRAGQDAEAYEAVCDQIDRANRKSDRIKSQWFQGLHYERRELGVSTPNLWLAMNSVTKWVQHERQVKGGSGDPLMRMWSNKFSDGASKSDEAYDIALSVL